MAVTTFVTAICVCGSQAVALTLPAGPTGPVPVPTTTVPVAPTLPSPTSSTPKLSTPTVSTPKLSTPKAPTVTAPKVSAPKLSAPKVSAPTTTVTKKTQTVLGQANLPSGGGSAGSTAGPADQGSSTLRSPLLRSVSRLASGSTGTSGGGLSSTLAGPIGGGGGGAAGPGGGSGISGSGSGTGGGPGAGGGAGGGPLAAATVLLRAEAGLFAGALTGTRGASFEALQAAVAGLAGCVGEVGPVEQRLLVLRFGLAGGRPSSLGAVARALGISRAGALRTERRALRSLRVASATTGCAAAGSGIATIFDPTTIGLPAVTLLGASASASGFPTAGQQLAAGVAGAAAPVWPRLSHGDIGWLLIALATLGALLTLAGALMRGWAPPLPLPAGSRALERVRRPAAAAGRQVRGRGPRPLSPRFRYRRPDQRSDS